LAWFGLLLLAATAIDVYLEFGLGLTGLSIIIIAAGERAEFMRLAPWFRSCGCPGSPMASQSWGTLAVRSATWRRP
jgi:hypothetical protein